MSTRHSGHLSEVFSDTRSFLSKNGGRSEKRQKLEMLFSQFTALLSDDPMDDQDDDDEIEDDDFSDDDEIEFFSALSGHDTERIKVEPKDVRVDRVEVNATTLENVITKIDNKPAHYDILAAPGCGKTTKIPNQLANNGIPVVVVLTNETILANVAANNPRVKAVATNGSRDGIADLQYTTSKVVMSGFKPQEGLAILVDEVQEQTTEQKLLLERVTTDWAQTNCVITVRGTEKAEIHVKKSIEMKTKADWQTRNEKRVLVVHSDLGEINIPRINRDSQFKLTGDFQIDLEVFERILKLDRYVIHADYQLALGLDLILDAVYCEPNIIVNNQIRQLNDAEVFQMINRLCRRSDRGIFYGPSIGNSLNGKRRITLNPPGSIVRKTLPTTPISVDRAIADRGLSYVAKKGKTCPDRFIEERLSIVRPIDADRICIVLEGRPEIDTLLYMRVGNQSRGDEKGNPYPIFLNKARSSLNSVLSSIASHPGNDELREVLLSFYLDVSNTVKTRFFSFQTTVNVGQKQEYAVMVRDGISILDDYRERVHRYCDGRVPYGIVFNSDSTWSTQLKKLSI